MDDPTQYFDGTDYTGDATAQVNPPNVSDPSINPGLQQYMQMLGMPSAGVPATGGGMVSGAMPTLPMGGGGAVPGFGAPPLGTFPSWLNLGISGQIGQQGQGIPVFSGTNAINYAPPPKPQQKQNSSGGGGGILGSIGGFL